MRRGSAWRRGACTLLAGFVAGIGYPAISVYWLLNMPFPVGSVGAWLLVIVWAASFVAAWVWFSWKIVPRRPATPARPTALQDDRLSHRSANAKSAENEQAIQLGDWSDRLVACSLGRKMLWLLSIALVWTSLEVVRSHFAGGLPWNFVGASQVHCIALIQFASIAGIYGVSFLIVWFSVSFGLSVFLWRRASWASGLASVAVPASVVGLVMLWGFFQIDREPAGGERLKTVLIQPSIPQKARFTREEIEAAFQKNGCPDSRGIRAETATGRVAGICRHRA